MRVASFGELLFRLRRLRAESAGGRGRRRCRSVRAQGNAPGLSGAGRKGVQYRHVGGHSRTALDPGRIRPRDRNGSLDAGGVRGAVPLDRGGRFYHCVFADRHFLSRAHSPLSGRGGKGGDQTARVGRTREYRTAEYDDLRQRGDPAGAPHHGGVFRSPCVLRQHDHGRTADARIRCARRGGKKV